MRERKEDIVLLINRFIRAYQKDKKDIPMEEDTLSMLMNYEYPGNVRELKSIIQSSLNLSQGRPITPEFLPSYLEMKKPAKKTETEAAEGPIAPMADVEKRHILNVYRQLDENKAKTAKTLGIGLNTLRRKLDQYGAQK